MISEIFQKNNFVTAAAEAAGIDDSIKQKRIGVSLKNGQNAVLTTWGGISRERFKRGYRNLRRLSWTIGSINLLDMTSPAFPDGCKMQLNTAQNGENRVRSAKESNNSVTV